MSMYLEALVTSVMILPVSLYARYESIVPKTQRPASRRSFTRGTFLMSQTILEAEKYGEKRRPVFSLRRSAEIRSLKDSTMLLALRSCQTIAL